MGIIFPRIGKLGYCFLVDMFEVKIGLFVTYFVLFIICLFLNGYYPVSENMSIFDEVIGSMIISVAVGTPLYMVLK